VIGIFKKKSPANIVLLFVLGVLLKLPMFFHPHVIKENPGQGSFFKAILDFLEPTASGFPELFPILAFTFLFTQALMLTHFMNSQRMFSRSTYMPGMAYMLITSLIPEWNYFSAPLLINTILLFVLSRLFIIYNQQQASGTIYNIGLSLGIASFIYFPALTFIIWILLALMVMRPFRINEWVICILGITTPFYFYAIYLFLTDQWNWQTLWPNFSISLPIVDQSAWLAGSAFLLIVPFLIGGYYVQDNLRRVLIHIRKGWSLILLYLLGAIFIPFVNNSENFENWVIAAIPFAAFHACAYLYANLRIIPLLLFWLTVAFVLGYQYYGPGWN